MYLHVYVPSLNLVVLVSLYVLPYNTSIALKRVIGDLFQIVRLEKEEILMHMHMTVYKLSHNDVERKLAPCAYDGICNECTTRLS